MTDWRNAVAVVTEWSKDPSIMSVEEVNEIVGPEFGPLVASIADHFSRPSEGLARDPGTGPDVPGQARSVYRGDASLEAMQADRDLAAAVRRELDPGACIEQIRALVALRDEVRSLWGLCAPAGLAASVSECRAIVRDAARALACPERDVATVAADLVAQRRTRGARREAAGGARRGESRTLERLGGAGRAHGRR